MDHMVGGKEAPGAAPREGAAMVATEELAQ
jgi:hypothetical protein